jgi:hypothetical protein
MAMPFGGRMITSGNQRMRLSPTGTDEVSLYARNTFDNTTFSSVSANFWPVKIFFN